MSLNVGNISARFGLDPAEFLERLRGVSGSTKLFSDEMRRSMKETSREGNEAFRLIDESLGIHVSRPLTRLLTREFPSFAKGLQSVLGLGAAGALATAGFELFEKVSKGIEKAQKAQEELRSATLGVEIVFAQEMTAYTEKNKAISSATEKVNKLIEAEEKETAAMLAASGPWSHMLATIGDFTHQTFSFQSTLNIEATSKQLDEFKRKFDSLALTDSIKGSHDAMKLLADEIVTAGKNYDELKAKSAVPMKFYYSGPGAGPALTQNRITPEELSAADKYKDDLKKISDLWNTILAAVRGKEAESAALSRQREAAAAAASLSHTMAESITKLEPETNPLKKLFKEIDGLMDKAEREFYELGKTSNSALQLRQAEAALDSYESHLKRIYARAKADADVLAAEAELPKTISATGTAPQFAAPSAIPNAGGVESHAAAKLNVFSKDDQAQMEMADKAYEQAMTAQQKFALGKQELDLLVQKGLIDTIAQKAAMSDLDQQMIKAASSANKLQEEIQKLLEKSNDASAGLKAYAIQLQLNAEENGKFVYDVLTSATKSGTEDATKSLMAVLEEQRGGHRALIHELEKLWSDYFKNIATMGMKNAMDKALAPLGKAIAGGGTNPSADNTKPGSALPSGLLGWLTPKAVSATGAGGTASLSAAGTMLTHAGAELLSAAMALKASAGVGGGASAGGGGSPFGDITSLGGAIPFFASGGDATPGSSFVSGEAGAERVNLDGRGGAHITPLEAKAGGGDIHIHNNDFRGVVMTDDLMRRAEGIAAIHASEGRMMAALPAMQREISLRKRS
jgi:hypothetical protein